jgi:hypothetical protein
MSTEFVVPSCGLDVTGKGEGQDRGEGGVEEASEAMISASLTLKVQIR